jgi:hypothetical protein
MLHCFTELHSLHIKNGVLKYSSCIKPILTSHEISKLVLTDMKVVVTPGALQDLKPHSNLIAALGQAAAVSLENCTFEAADDSLQLNHLTALLVGYGAQVGWLRPVRGSNMKQHHLE